MSDYILHNIVLTLPSQTKMFVQEDEGKPISRFPQHYLGKLIGRAGSQLPLKRLRKGSVEEEVENSVLRNENGIALLRIHNKEAVNIVEMDESSDSEIPEYRVKPLDSYPYGYVVIDYRDDKLQIAIEKISSWDSKTDMILKILQEYFSKEMSSQYNIDCSIKPKYIATKFERFIDERLVKHRDVIESFTFEYPNLKRNPGVRIPECMTSNIQQMSSVLEIYNALKGKIEMSIGQDFDKEKLKGLSTVVSYCSDNTFDISVHFRDFKDYKFNEDILAKYVMNDVVINTYRTFAIPEVVSKDFDLKTWLDYVFEDIKNIENNVAE